MSKNNPPKILMRPNWLFDKRKIKVKQKEIKTGYAKDVIINAIVGSGLNSK